MSHQPFSNRVLAATLVAALLCVTAIHAKKPGNPGGGGGGDETVPPGIVYFSSFEEGSSIVSAMNADGSAKTLIGGAQAGEASYQLHGGLRWFLDSRGLWPESYPDGEEASQLVAYSAGGGEVVLLDDVAIQPYGQKHWIRNSGDTWISFGGRSWLVDPQTGDYVIDPDTGAGIIVEEGVYVAEVAFHPNTGLVDGLIPGSLILATSIEDLGGTLAGHDWAPDAAAAVLAISYASSNGDLFLADPAAAPADMFSLLYGGGPGNGISRPAWSPDGSRIAFNSAIGITILDFSNGREKAIRDGASFSVAGPSWSPNGEHLLYHRFDHSSFDVEIYRATASGGSKANLTPEDCPDAAFCQRFILGWRE